MTNREKYKDELVDIAINRKLVAVSRQGEIVSCEKADCKNCIFYNRSKSCAYLVKEWSGQEYAEPPIDIWSKVAVDTPILVSMDNDKWYKRYFADYKDGKVYAWDDGRTSWTAEQNICEWEFAKLVEQED